MILTKNNRYREYIIDELIKTEKNYIDDLERLIVVKNLMSQWLTKQKLDIIFMNVLQIRQLNDQFYKEINNLPNKVNTIGEKLKEFAPFFKIYFIYYEGFNKSTILLKQSASESSEIKKFLQEIPNYKDFNQQDIDSLLIKPVQRLPKYKLLIEDLIKNTTKYHQDYQNLQDSLLKFNKVAEDINLNMSKFLNSQLFDIAKWCKDYIQDVINTKRIYVTEFRTIILHNGNELFVTIYCLTDLIIAAQTQASQYPQYIQSVYLDQFSECLDIADQQYIKNSFLLNGINGKSITFIEQNQDEKQEKIKKLQDIIDELKDKHSSKMSTIQKNLIKVTAVGVDQREEKFKIYNVYIIEVGIGNIYQKIYVRYSQCLKLQEYLKNKYPNIKLNNLKQGNAFNFTKNEDKEIESRQILIQSFILSVLQSDIVQNDIKTKILKDLGLPENFFNLPNEIKDEMKQQQEERIGIHSYISPQRTLTRGSSISKDSQNKNQPRRFSACGFVKKDITIINNGITKHKPNQSKEFIQIIIHHFFNEKHLTLDIQINTKVFHVLEQIKNEFQLINIHDFKLLIYDHKQRLKALQNDEQISDLFGSSLFLDLKKKELYLKKYLFFNIEQEKILLYEDNIRVKAIYNQFVKDILTAQLTFKQNESYIKTAAMYYFLQNKPLTYEILQQIIPNSILKLKQKEYWLCTVNEEYKSLKNNDNASSTMIENIEQETKTEDNIIQQSKSLFLSFININKKNEKQKQWESQHIDENKGMMTLITFCLNNELTTQQFFKVTCKEALQQFGEQNLILAVNIEGIKLYNSTKDRIWQKIETIESFNVFPGSIEITYGQKKYKLETNQGFQIQSLFDEYQALNFQDIQNQ